MTNPATYRIALIGAGMMGVGLARLFRSKDWPVAVYDSNVAVLSSVPEVRYATSLADVVTDADFVIEAASERLEIKQAIFAELATVSAPETILATNSSVIPVGAITVHLDDEAAARTVGMHFWNPPDIIPLVEVIEGPRTSNASAWGGMAMLRAAGKEPIHVRRDTVPGNRLQHALWREAMALVDEGVCTPEDIDTIVKRSFGLRLSVLGPLENADLVGLPLTAEIHSVVLPTLSRAMAPATALTDRIARGDLGVGTGAGFYDAWPAEKVSALRHRLADHLRRATAVAA